MLEVIAEQLGLTQLGGRLRPLADTARHRVERRGAEPLAILVGNQPLLLDRMLEVARVADHLRRSADDWRAEGVLRDGLLRALLSGPVRPGDLARRLDCDPAQITRALRELEREALAKRVPSPTSGGDRRAVWYAAA